MATAGPKERAGLREPPVQKTPGEWMSEIVARDIMAYQGRGSKRRQSNIIFVNAQCGTRLTNKLSNEKTQPDPHWRNEVPLVLFGCKHEYREDELRGQNHFYNDTLGDCRSASKGG